ncbi:MAG: ribosomal protein S18-alanine N-acetyltransferase [Nitrospirota bacterium]|nr:ribosomal protein S18-alanine N-acetyltransferase [Nitrospirota bacterium]MDH5769152.1 ribosomal protein S18-alanine N-acetyltransferase [Nitrospirota bacterium]
MAEVFIRDMNEPDLPAVLEIEHISFTIPWSIDSFIHELRNQYSITKVAVIEDNVIGYICAHHIIDESHILNLAVHPDFRRCGIATKLVKEVLDELEGKGCRFIYLEVRVSNLVARNFYARLGFKEVGVRRNYYTSPREDAIIMMREP